MLRRSILFLTLLLLGGAAQASQIVVLELEGVIGPASKDYVVRGLEQAQQRGADLVVLKMNTPGGLDDSMRAIIQAILGSRVPVASYVAPGGARAASAGTYILYASHIAAMAPATNLGAATPVQLGGGGPELPDLTDKDRQDGKSPSTGDQGTDDEPAAGKQPSTDKPADEKAPGTAMERKMVNDARAYIRSLAQLRGRNVEWAEQAVQQAASLSAQEALDKNVIDILAKNLNDLLQQADGRTVEVDGEPHTLALADPVIETLAPDWRNKLLAIITHPQVAYILMLLGIYGLFFEFSNPGSLVPGVLGGICLLLALFAFQVLPVNYAGLALIALGLAFMIGEAFMPSFGILGLGGVAAFVVGSIILWDEQAAGYEIPLALIAGFALASAALFIGLGTWALRHQRRRPVTGDQALTGEFGIVQEDFAGDGWVRVHGESWRARCDRPLSKGTRVRVLAREGLTLEVQPEDNTHD